MHRNRSVKKFPKTINVFMCFNSHYFSKIFCIQCGQSDSSLNSSQQFPFLIYLSLKNRKFHHWSRRNRPLNSLNGYYEEVDQKWKNLIVFFNKCQTYVGNGLNTLFFKS